ncbi:MAG: T9SS type A sorting domain-containing protein, partial [Bacteroidales bacterium]|nr:T9SS type A sorting domain-containing protein [Bacteroidales bacterium]
NLIKLNNLDDGGMSYTGIILKTGDSNLMSAIQDYGINYTASNPYDFGGFLNLSNNSRGLMLHANSEQGVIKFYTGHDDIEGAGIERLRIDSAGNIGIGTAKPNARVEIADGDIYISDIEKGIIMKSPDGQCWRGTLDNNGSLTFTQVDCPNASTTTKATESVISSNKEISIYPNPTTDFLNIDVKNVDPTYLTYHIYDMNGRLMNRDFVGSKNKTIDISSLASGYYLMNINDKLGNQLFSKKIVKK